MRTRDKRRLRKQIQDRVEYCSNCQPWEGGEPVWIFGARTSLDYIMDEYDIQDDVRDEIADGICCPSCGTELDRFDEVGEAEEWELEERRRWRRWASKFGPRLDEFAEHLAAYPGLGLAHKVGRSIFRDVRVLQSWTIEDGLWFRARVRPNDPIPTPQQLGPAPLGSPIPEGRFNHQGHPLFYLADSDRGAATEATRKDLPATRAYWVQGFRIREMGLLLDLRSESYDLLDDKVPLLATGLMHSRRLEERVDREAGWKPAYYVPRFIADCARQAGYAGIIYRSARHYSDNIVLFTWADKVTPEGVPTAIRPDPIRSNPFLDELDDPTVVF